MTPTPPADPLPDAERDAHLQGALRHAPDAQLAPPVAVSEAILRAAHGAVAPAPARQTPGGAPRLKLLRGLAAAWNALGQRRWAGAVAGLMVATLVGVLWWGQPIEPGVDRAPRVELRSNDSAAQPAAETLAKGSQPAAAQLESARVAKSRDAQAAPGFAGGRATASIDPAAASAKAAAAVAKSSLPDAARESDNSAAPAEMKAPARREAVAAVAEVPAAPAAELERPAADARQVGAAQDRAAPSTGVAAAAAPTPSAERAEARAMARQRGEPASRGTTDTALQLPPPAAIGGLTQLRRAIAAEPERWTWRLDVQPPRAMTSELQAWLAQLDAAAGAVLVEGAAPQAPSAGTSAAQTLHLLRDSQLHSSLTWSDAALHVAVAGTGQVSRRAGPAAHRLRELDAALAQIAAR